MSPSGDGLASFSCPRCGRVQDLPDREPTAGATPPNCPDCAELMTPLPRSRTDSAPASPFDDLFDERGEPNWTKQAGGSETAPLEPLEFPAEPDASAFQPAASVPLLQWPTTTTDPTGRVPLGPVNLWAEETAPNPIPATPGADSGEQLKRADQGDRAAPSPPNPAPRPLHPGEVSTGELRGDELGLTPLAEGDLDLQRAAGGPSLSPIFAAGDGRLEDENQPLRIEGLEDAGPAETMTGVRCRICDTLIYVQRAELGQKVKCPECYSEVLAQEASPRKTTAGGFPQQHGQNVVWSVEQPAVKSSREEVSEDEYRLSEPVERPKVEVPVHYGLEPAGADLLAPQPSRTPANAPAPRSTPASRSESNRRESPPPGTPALPPPSGPSRWKAEPSRPGAASPISRSEVPRGTGPDSGSADKSADAPFIRVTPASEPKKPRRSADATSASEESSNTFQLVLDDLSAPGPALWGWLAQLAADARLWAAAGLAVLALGAGYWLLGLAGIWLGGDEPRTIGTTILAALFGLPGLVLFLSGMGLAAIIAALLFHLGTRQEPRFSAWSGNNFSDWGPAVGFVAFGFWLAVMPGALCGMLLAALSGAPLWVYALGAISGSLFAPLLLASVCRNDSPFQVYDRAVFQRVRFERVDWLKFLPGSMFGLGPFLAGTLLLLIPGISGSFLGALGQVAGWVIFGSVTGLFCGLLVEKVNSEESPK